MQGKRGGAEEKKEVELERTYHTQVIQMVVRIETTCTATTQATAQEGEGRGKVGEDAIEQQQHMAITFMAGLAALHQVPSTYSCIRAGTAGMFGSHAVLSACLLCFISALPGLTGCEVCCDAAGSWPEVLEGVLCIDTALNGVTLGENNTQETLSQQLCVHCLTHTAAHTISTSEVYCASYPHTNH